MSVPEPEKQARLLLSQCMVEILRPASPVDVGLPLNERLIGYAIAFGVYGGQPLGINKLAELVGLPRSTVRDVIAALIARGWVIRQPDKTYDFSTEFHSHADEWFALDTKYNAIVRTANGLHAVGKAAQLSHLVEAESDPSPIDRLALKAD